MLTPEQRETAYRQADDFTEACADYRALLATHDLPLTVNLAQLEALYRGRLFDELLQADPGLRARYELARTPDAKQQLRAQTVGSLDLRGHELPEQLAQAVAGLEHALLDLLAHGWPNDVPRLSLAQLASSYGLDYGRLLDARTMQWAGKEAAQAYFAQLGQVLTGWRALQRGLGKNVSTLSHTLEQLDTYFPNQLPAQGPIVADEHKLYAQLQLHPELLDALAGLPAPTADLLGDWLDEDELDALAA